MENGKWKTTQDRSILRRFFFPFSIYHFPFAIACALLVGCQSNATQPLAQKSELTVPRGAEVVAEGSRDLSYKAPADGRIYAMDQQTQTVAFSKRVRAGQKLDFRADNGTVSLDGRPLRIANLDQHRGHAFRLYFEKAEQ